MTENLTIKERYVGGIIFWIDDKINLPVIYIVDCCPAYITNNNTLEVPICLTNMEAVDADYQGSELIAIALKAYPLTSIEKILKLIDESDKQMYHITNVEWSLDDGWFFWKSMESLNYCFHDFTQTEIKETIQLATDVTIFIDLIACKKIKIEDLEEYMKKKKIWNDIWYVYIDLTKL